MSTWTKEDQQRYFYVMECRERRQKRNRTAFGLATAFAIALILAFMIRVMVES